MKFTAPATLLAASVLSPLVSATAYLSYCQVSHSSNGNDFLIKVQSIPDVSKSSICGSSDRQIRSSAKGWSINVKYLTCDTGKTTPDMQILVKLDKQSPSTQRTALFNGLQAAFGSQGFNWNANQCNLAGIPT
ncbi:hypothetical protein B0J11DRAFT_613109 [Dendryphion nanum]|uniref:AA1-like domain-containing protein n=1 Tax=Dendryphion nanum TaxID=256645 RepID=A0A9P9E209_9PLEO|nr:hypothetical protein B0J11DRAFT_613109 [Dendryphion nanum]